MVLFELLVPSSCSGNSRTPTTISRGDLRIKTFSCNDVIQNNTSVHVGLIMKHDLTTHRFQQKFSCNITPFIVLMQLLMDSKSG